MNTFFTETERQTIEYYDQHADEWAKKRKKPSEPSFWKNEFEEFKRLKSPSGKVLELGSAAGREAIELNSMGYEYVGVDVSKELLKIAQSALPNGQFYYSSAYHLPFPANYFDAFFSSAMLPHVPKVRLSKALSSLKNVLKNDAIGFIAMREGIGEKQEPETGRWFSYYTQEELNECLQHNGFTIIRKNRKPSRADLVWLTFFVTPVSDNA